MTLPVVLFFLQDIPLAMFFIAVIILFFVGNLIFLCKLIRKNSKNKKTIEQAKTRLKKIQKAKSKIEKQAKAKNLFYTSLIHEIKIPLSIIHNSLIAYCTNQKKKDDKDLITIKTNLETLTRDIVNLLDAEKIKHTHRLYDHTTILNISKAIKQEVEVFKYNTNNKKIALTLLSEGSLYIKIDPFAFDRIVNNLLDNAIKYTQKGGEINISLKSNPSFIYLAIKDHGVGIPENQLNKIFKPYYRIKKESYRQGIGIGLFLVKKIIESVNGRIKVKSEPGKGSTFTIIFPKCKPYDIENIADVIPAGPVRINGFELLNETYDKNKYTIMLVEDHLDMLKFLQNSLLDYNVYYAVNGQKAIDKLSRIPKPDIIISDIMMETMNGHELFNELSEIDKFSDIPFIFLTSSTEKEEKLKSLKAGVIDFITKPFLIEELKAKINSILKNRELAREIDNKRMLDRLATAIKTKGDDKFIFFEKIFKKYSLSPREKEVVQYLLTGLLLKEIADKMCLSIHTIRNHIKHIYVKCKVQNRTEFLNIFKE